jgi:hypothetical protein
MDSISFAVRVVDVDVAIVAPKALGPTLLDFFKLCLSASPAGPEPIRIAQEGDAYRIEHGERTLAHNLKLAQVLARLGDILPEVAKPTAEGNWLHAAAVGWGDRIALVAGRTRIGRSSLASWLIDKGFSLHAAEYVFAGRRQDAVAGLAGPLFVPDEAALALMALESFQRLAAVDVEGGLIVAPAAAWRSPGDLAQCGLVIISEFSAGAPCEIDVLDFGRDQDVLDQTFLTALKGDKSLPPSALAVVKTIPIVRLRFGDLSQLDGVVDHLVRSTLDNEVSAQDFARFATALHGAAGIEKPSPARRFEMQTQSDRRLSKFLTIGMATYDDYDGVYFSVQALRMYHPEILDDIEILLVDNHPDGPSSLPLKQLEHHIPNYRYAPVGHFTGTAVRDAVFSQAGGEFVLCMDSHVFFVPGALRRLIEYFREFRDTRDLVQGPLVYDDLRSISTHLDPVWRAGMYGTWATDPRGADPEAEPFEIPMQGLGVFACRRAAWPGFNPKFRGFGGEEGYIHEKFRQNGGRTLCLPFLRWMHRFNRPLGIPYRNTWDDRFRNYMIGFAELGLSVDDVKREIVAILGEESGKRLIEAFESEFARQA